MEISIPGKNLIDRRAPDYTRIKKTGSVAELVAALKSCSSSKDLATGRKLHARAMETGNATNIFVANTLIDMYAKSGSMPDARSVFDAMKQRSLVSWNTLVLGYAQSGDPELALELFQQMQEHGFLPDSCSLVAALRACSSLAERDQSHRRQQPRKSEQRSSNCAAGSVLVLDKAASLHALAVKSGHDSNLFVASSLVNLFCKLGNVGEAVKIFERMKKRSIVTWNSIIIGCAQNGEADLAMRLFSRMRDEGIAPDSRSFVGALEACIGLAEKEQGSRLSGEVVKISSLEKGMGIHSLAIESGQSKDLFVANTLIDMYSKCGRIDEALSVFDAMPNRDLVSWNILLLALAQSDRGTLALDLFQRFEQIETSIRPDSRTYVAALKACSAMAAREEPTPIGGELVKVASLETGFAILSRSVSRSDVFVANSLLDLYCKCGALVNARRFFDGLIHRSVVSWNTLILGYAQSCRDAERAIELLEEMKGDGIEPDELTFAAVLKACGNLAALSAGRKIHSEIASGSAIDLSRDTVLATAVVDFYGKCGSMAEALQVFESIRKKDSIAWGALVAGYSQQGDTQGMFQAVERMKKERVEIDSIVILHVLTACSHAGLVDRGMEFFQMMVSEEHRVDPAMEHYTGVIDLLARANHLEEAMAIVKSMPFEPDITVWTSIMNACRKWKNVAIGKIAFEAMLRLDASDPGAYALMANTFSESKRSTDAVD